MMDWPARVCGLVLSGLLASAVTGSWYEQKMSSLDDSRRPLTDTVTTVVVLSPEEWRDTLVVRAVRRLNEEAGQALVSETLMLAVARVENRRAVPTAVSSAGAVGLMQVMPSVWQGAFPVCGSDLYDPETNVCYGVRIYVYHLLRCDGDELCALADYNGAVTSSRRTLYQRQVAAAREAL